LSLIPSKPYPLPTRYPLPPERRKPYIPQAKGKSMTIAAGFRCGNGVLLAADTEITIGDLAKTQHEKIFDISERELCWLTYAGTEEFALELVSRLHTNCPGKSDGDLIAEIKRTYQDTMDELFTQPPEGEKAYGDILVTLKHGTKMVLYKATNRAFVPVIHHAFWGIAQNVGESIFRTLYWPTLSVREVAYLVVYAFQRAKGYSKGVGGITQLIGVEDSTWKRTYFPAEETREIEENMDYFEAVIRPILASFSDLQVTSKRFSEIVKAAVENLKERRSENFEKQKLQDKQGNRRIRKMLDQDAREGEREFKPRRKSKPEPKITLL
jgi:hypothetical protein